MEENEYTNSGGGFSFLGQNAPRSERPHALFGMQPTVETPDITTTDSYNRRVTRARAENADMASVGYNEDKFAELMASGRGLSQISDDELDFIRDRYSKSDISKRKAYTNSAADQFLSSAGLPSSKELASYRQKYIDYVGNGGMEQYSQLLEKRGDNYYFTDTAEWIKNQWEKDNAEGLLGETVTSGGKDIKYEDTLLDEQLKAEGFPPSAQLNEYYLKYKEKQKANKDKEARLKRINAIYDEVMELEDGGMDRQEAFDTVVQNPKYADIVEKGLVDYEELPSPTDPKYKNDTSSLDEDRTAVIKKNAKYDNMEERISLQDYEKHRSDKKKWSKYVEQQSKLEPDFKSALVTPATTESDKKKQYEAISKYLSTVKVTKDDGSLLTADDYSGYLHALNAGIPIDVINKAQTQGFSAFEDWNDTVNGKDLNKWAETKAMLDGLSKDDDGIYNNAVSLYRETHAATGLSNYSKDSKYDPALYDAQISPEMSTSRSTAVSASGAIYNAVNGKGYGNVVGASESQRELLKDLTDKTLSDSSLIDLMSDDEKGTFNLIFKESANRGLSYLQRLQPVLEQRRDNALFGKVMFASSKENAEDSAYKLHLSESIDEINNIIEGTSSYWKKEAWDRYSSYSDEALQRIVEENSDENVNYSTTEDYQESEDLLSVQRAAQFVLDTRKQARDDASVESSLYGYKETDGKKATEEINKRKAQDLPDELSRFINGKKVIQNDATDINTMASTDAFSAYTATSESRLSTEEQLFINNMTEDQKNRYNWLLLHGEKGDAQRYFDYIRRGIDKKAAASVTAGFKEFGKENPFVASVGSVLTYPIGGMSAVLGSVDRLISGKEISDTDAALWDITGSLREGVQERISDSFENEGFANTLNFLYNVGMSSADSFLGAVVSKATVPFAGELMLSSSAYASTLRAGLSRGLDREKAVQMAVASAAIEFVTEHMGIDNLVKGLESIAKNAAAKGSTSYMMNVLAQMGINFIPEALEEGVGHIAETMADMMINGDASELMEYYDSLIAKGMSKEEANKLVSNKFASETALEMLAGGLAGSESVGVGGTLNYGKVAATHGVSAWTNPESTRTWSGGHSKDFGKGKAIVDSVFGKEFSDSVQGYIDTAETVLDKQNINEISELLPQMRNTDALYDFVFDEKGNMKLSNEELVALSAALNSAGADADLDSIEQAYSDFQTGKQSPRQRLANTNYKYIKTSQELHDSRAKLNSLQNDVENAKRDYQGELDETSTKLKDAESRRQAVDEKIHAIEEEIGNRFGIGTGKLADKLISLYAQQATLITEVNNHQNALNKITGEKKRILDTTISNCNSQIRDIQRSLDRHWASYSNLLATSTTKRSAYEAQYRFASMRVAEIGNQIDSLISSDTAYFANSEKYLENMDNLQTQLAEAQQEMDFWDRKRNKTAPSKLSDAIAAAHSGTVKEFLDSTEPAKAAAPATANTANTAETANTPSNTAEQANQPSDAVKQENTAQGETAENATEEKKEEPKKAVEKKTYTISKTTQEKFDRIAKKFGLEIVWQTRAEIGGNGRYSSKEPNKIYLATDMIADKGLLKETVVAREFFTHEVVHYVANTQWYQRLSNLAEAWYKYSGDKEYGGGSGDDYFEFLINEQIKQEKELHHRDFTREQAREELTAYFVQDVLFTDKNGTESLDWLTKMDGNAVQNFLGTVEYLIKRGQVRRMKDGSAIKTLLLDAEHALGQAIRERKVLDAAGMSSAFSTGENKAETAQSQTVSHSAEANAEQSNSEMHSVGTTIDELSQRFGDFFKGIRSLFSNKSSSVETESDEDWYEWYKKNYPESNQSESQASTVESNSLENFVIDDEKYNELARRYKNGDASVIPELQSMVDSAARKSGYTKEVFHGTNAQFDSFDVDAMADVYNRQDFGASGLGIYLGDKETASGYGTTANGRMINAYIDNSRIAQADSHHITLQQLESAINELGISKDAILELTGKSSLEEYMNGRNDYDLIYALQEYMYTPSMLNTETRKKPSEILSIMQRTLNLDGVAVDNKNHTYDGIDPYWFRARKDETVLWDNRLIKYANLVTESNNGEIIPLSQRFNRESGDLRYSAGTTISDLASRFNPNASGRAATLSGDDIAVPNAEEAIDKSAVLVNENGDPVMNVINNGNGAMFSTGTWDAGGKDAFKKYLDSKKIGKDDIQKAMDQMESIYKICRDLEGKHASFSQWADAEVTKNDNGTPVFSVIRSNSEYPMNLDFSLVCVKRRTLDAVFNEVIRQGKMEDIILDDQAIVLVNEAIRKAGYEAACTMCFVEAKRFQQSTAADRFVEKYNKLVKSLGGDADYFNFGGNGELESHAGIQNMSDSNLDFTEIDRVLQEFTKRKNKKIPKYNPNKGVSGMNVEEAIAYELKNNPASRRLVLRGDFMSTKGFDSVAKNAPNVLTLYNKQKGTGGPKASFGDMQYLNDIENKKWKVQDAYAVGGVRVQSFSDFVPYLAFDYVQMVSDLAAGGLPAHAYTKEKSFALLFGLTGMKINMSLVPMVADDGLAVGLMYERDANGNIVLDENGQKKVTYAWATESFGFDRKNNRVDYDFINRIQSDSKYGKNCGTIAIGVSDEHIERMMADPAIKMIIPYHKSSLNPIVAKMEHIDAFDDYTKTQHTRKKVVENGETKWKNLSAKEEYPFNTKLRQLGDPKAVVADYLAWCEQHEYAPKFEKDNKSTKFKNNEGYYKVLEDFTLYDNNGNYVPQGAVKLNFPTEEDIDGSFSQILDKALGDYEKYRMVTDADTEKLAKEVLAISDRRRAEREASDKTMYASGDDSTDWLDDYGNERALQKGDMENDFNNALTRKEWAIYYKAVFNSPVFQRIKIGKPFFTLIGNNKFLLAKKTSKDDFSVVDAIYAFDDIMAQELYKYYSGHEVKYGRDSIERWIKGINDASEPQLFERYDRQLGWSSRVLERQKSDEDSTTFVFRGKPERNGRRTSSTVGRTDRQIRRLLSEEHGSTEQGASSDSDGRFSAGTTISDLSQGYTPLESINDVRKIFNQRDSRSSGVDDARYMALAERYKSGDTSVEEELNNIVMQAVKDTIPNTKAVDENGDPLVVYHGTSEKFTVFDRTKGRSTMDIQGMFFSPWEIEAGGYGENVGKYYLNIKKPANESVAYKALNMFKGQNNAGVKAREYLVSRGYDGVIGYDELIAFNSNQIKSADPVTYDDKGNIIPLSERFNESDSDIRYSNGTTMKDLIASYGKKRQSGLGMLNDVQTAERTSKSTRISDVAQTVKEAPAQATQEWKDHVDDIVVEVLDENAVPVVTVGKNAGLVYRPMTMEEMNELGDEYITRSGGVDQAMRDLARDIPNATVSDLTKLEAAAMRVIAEVSKTNNFNREDSAEFLAALGILNSNWGRMGKAMQLLNNSPLGRRKYMEKVVERLNAENKKKFGKGAERLFHRNGVKEIVIPESKYRDLELATTPEEVRKAEFRISEEIGKQSPLSISDAVRNWRYFAMLANPVTHGRNLLGNTGMLGMRMAKDAIAAGLENVAVKTGFMDAEDRTHYVNRAIPKEVADYAVQLFFENAEQVQGQDRYGVRDKIHDAVKKSPIKLFDTLMRFNGDMLEKEDKIFLRMTYVSAAKQYMMSRGLTNVNDLTAKQKAEIHQYAKQQAQEATYRDASALADTLNALAKKGGAWQFAIESTIPFKKTPINITKRGIEYSPVGLAKGVIDLAKYAVNKGKNADGQYRIPASKIADELGKGLVGSALALIGAFLAKAGILKLKAGDGDRDEAYEKDLGHQDYSLEIGNMSIKIESLVPMTFPLFVGAAAMDALSSEEKKAFIPAMSEAMLSIADPIMDMSFMSSLNNTLNSYSKNKLLGIAQNAVSSYASQFAPTVIGRLNSSLYPTRRTTKSSQKAKEGIGTENDYTLRSIASKTPGLNLALEPYVKTTGEYDVKDSFGDYLLAHINAFLSPVNVQMIDTNPVKNEIARLVETTGSVDFVPQNPQKYFKDGDTTYNLTAKEYTEYSKDHNETVYAMLKDVINSEEYQNAETDDDRADLLKKAYNKSHEVARKKWKAIIIERHSNN